MIQICANAYVNINILGTGLLLPYSIGIIGYIKKHIPIKSYRLTGVSGGAWCSLLYALENDLSDHDKIWNYTMGDKNIKLNILSNLDLFHNNIENNLKLRYKGVDAEMIKHISILASRYDNKKIKLYSEKKSEFKNINDLIDFCTCSSYIPYISGVLLCKEYDNKYYMDGDITRDVKLINIKSSYSSLSIHRHMWGRKFSLSNYIYSDINKSRELFELGWKDAEKNRDVIMRYIPQDLEDAQECEATLFQE
jgi:predicted patatin/cPLA2 family phospholipase